MQCINDGLLVDIGSPISCPLIVLKKWLRTLSADGHSHEALKLCSCLRDVQDLIPTLNAAIVCAYSADLNVCKSIPWDGFASMLRFHNCINGMVRLHNCNVVVVSLLDVFVVVYLLLSIYTFTETLQAPSTALLQTDSNCNVVVYLFDVNVVVY